MGNVFFYYVLVVSSKTLSSDNSYPTIVVSTQDVCLFHFPLLTGITTLTLFIALQGQYIANIT